MQHVRHPPTVRPQHGVTLPSVVAMVLAACSSTITPSNAADAIADRASDAATSDSAGSIDALDTDAAPDDGSGCDDSDVCSAPPRAACESGVCGIRCDAGFHLCGTTCASDVDVTMCGASCVVCAAPPNATARCEHATCAFVCNAGFHRCGSRCVSDADVATCGTSCAPCTVSPNAVPTCDGNHCDFVCSPGYVRTGDVCTALAPPRPLAPLSTATVTSRRPTLRWSLAPGSDGARIDICRDRACTSAIATFDAVGSSIAPDADLPAGIVYWRLRGRASSAIGRTFGPTWQFTIGTRRAPHDASWGSVPDVNGDGYADVIVGAPVDSGSEGGSVNVFAGGASGLARDPTTSLANPVPGSAFGGSVASAGDVDGDGFSDVIVGAPSRSAEPGRAHLYRGSARGLGATPAISISGPAGLSESFGYAVAGVGDIDGDGYADVVVGAVGSGGMPGHAYVYLGGAAGLSSTPTITLSAPGGTLDFGESVAGAGDVDGDGFADVIIGEPSARRAYLYRGGVHGIDAVPTATLIEPRESPLRNFGIAVACAGDVNGDGFADVIVGAAYGMAYVFHGSATGLVPTPVTSLQAPAGSSTLFGFSVTGAGDLNGDGFADAIVAGYGSIDRTTVHAYLGGAEGLASAPVISLAMPDVTAFWFGSSVASAGDTDGDGFADFVVGTMFNSRAYVFRGDAAGVSAMPAILLSGPSGFGYAVATLIGLEWRRDALHAMNASRSEGDRG